MYKFTSSFTGETYESKLSPNELLRNVLRFTHESWKLYYLGGCVFAVANKWSIKFFRLWKSSSGMVFASDVVVQSDVAVLIRKYLKGGE